MNKTLLLGLVTLMNVSPVMANRLANEPIKPIQPFIITEPDKVELGKKLFFDPRLSRSGFISCNSCHNLSMGGSDNLPTSIGHNWQQGPINSPTVLNSSMNLAQFWDGRAADLQEQAAGPIANPMEMAFSHSLAIDVLRSIPQYVAEFNKIYGSDDITLDQVTNAIAVFEETLVTPNSRFDLWLNGNDNALTDTEIAGYQKFKQIGCVACHNGEAVGGSSFQRMGIMEPYQTDNPAEGRIAVTGKDADRFSFKVPTLRNVELTYPYFHDGAYWKLEDAVDVMARLQLGQQLEEQDIKNITAFLKTLTGDQPQFAIPQLPPSTPNTPIPVPFEN
ncbi:cytochrome-c peroxidase [Methylophaga muralis]|jgi:cytochrome c peroxidase|uniref:Cytochrome c551 peroxidase n=1 Tax=Methylophaga muralis TaxID=291169 RepID=A0A1E3GV23_9GAMM|nr:cytochrome-c peroxidase [Methylophaga muralis]ODN67211.1 Cytochrome c551 peroxidase precursor [Methylophaga muralis]